MHKTKRKIFEKSMELFANKGYDSTSIEEITAVVGIAKGTFYYHFPKKEDIFNFIVEEGMNLVKNSIEIKLKNLTDPLEKIKAIMLIQIKITIKYENFLRFLLGQMWGNENRNKICKKQIEEYISIIENVIKDGIATKQIKNGNANLMAYGVFNTIMPCLMCDNKSVSKLHRELFGYVLGTLM